MASALVTPCAKACGALCAEIAKVERLQVEAQMATEAYKPLGTRGPVGDFTEVSRPEDLKKLGLVPEDLEPSDSEFRAAVFRNARTGETVVAYKGTTMTSVADWMANGGHGTVGYSDYYSRAKLIGRSVAQKAGSPGVSSVKFVGHSLGGGLASAAAHATGQPASTFNAAGLHLFNRNVFNPPPIDAVRVNGEILTAVQKTMRGVPLIAPEASGTPYPIPPPANTASLLTRMALNKWDAIFAGVRLPFKFAKAALGRAVELHGMDAVNPALAEQRTRLADRADQCGCDCGHP
jgi:hypothetical protein